MSFGKVDRILRPIKPDEMPEIPSRDEWLRYWNIRVGRPEADKLADVFAAKGAHRPEHRTNEDVVLFGFGSTPTFEFAEPNDPTTWTPKP